MSYTPPEPLQYNFCPTCGERLVTHDDGERHQPHCRRCRRFFYHNPVPATCCFVRRDDGALLLVRRGLLEETGLRGGRLRLIGASARPGAISGAILVLGYLVEDWEGEPRAGSDVSEVRFYTMADRPNLVFTVHRDLLETYDALFP